MARFEVRVPAHGDSGESSYLTEWLADVGQAVTAGEPLLVLETNKAEFQVESPVTGILAEQLAQADVEITIGAVVAVIETG